LTNGCACLFAPLFAQLVVATVQMYNAIRAELLPTPNKSHYTFNLRDMGKVVQGLMRADPKTLGTQQQVTHGFVLLSSLCCVPAYMFRHRTLLPWHAAFHESVRYVALFDVCTTVSLALQVLSLWLHETCRVFEDRLTCQEDHDWFKQHQVDLVQEHFAMKHSDIVSTECLMFGNYLVPGAEPKVSCPHHQQ
jgi:dynein heavy chain